MPGIAHLILPMKWGLGESQLRRRLPGWNRQIGADALGALTWNADESSIDPLVYVPSAGTLVREHGCGSGSAAVGALEALRGGDGETVTDVVQPGGIIRVSATAEHGMIRGISISGKVRLGFC